MNWLAALLSDQGSFAHAMLAYSFIIALGLFIGRFHIRGISLGTTSVLFIGLIASYAGVRIDPALLGFFKNFGLILFVFFVGLQVGPSFFVTMKSNGLPLNLLMILAVLIGIAITIGIYFVSGGALTLPELLGVHFGAVTSTPGLGATQEALAQLGYKGDIAVGYACAYPLSILGIIMVLIVLQKIFRIDLHAEEQAWEAAQNKRRHSPIYFHVTVSNSALDGLTISEIRSLVGRGFICSRILHDGEITSPTGERRVRLGDKLRIVSNPEDKKALVAFCGEEDTKIDLATAHSPLVSRFVVVTREEMNGVEIGDLHLSRFDGVNITRVLRAGEQIFPYDSLRLQLGDRLFCVGPKNAVMRLATLMGNEEKQLERPNVMAIFIGIGVGILFGSMPIALPGMPVAIKLGLAGGPLIAAILLAYFGPRFHLVTYMTNSANLMLRQWGLTFFLASVGLGAGDKFFGAFIDGRGWIYVAVGFLITTVPMLTMGCIARARMKLNFHTIAGLIAGSSTSTTMLSFVNRLSEKGLAVVGYSTVYPLAMFLRIISGQIILLCFYHP